MKKHSFWKQLKSSLNFNQRMLFLIPYVLGAALFIILPICLMIFKATETLPNGEDNLLLIKDISTWKIMGNSVWLGLLASVISLVIALPFAYFVGQSKSKTFRFLMMMLILSPLLVFSVARVFSLKVLLLNIFDNPEAIKSKAIMIVGMVYLFMPFMIIPIYSVIVQMPESMIDAAKDLGSGSFKTITKVIIPYSLKAIFAGLAIVFMLSSTTLVISRSLLNSYNQEYLMIGNKIDQHARLMTQQVDSVWGSTLALATIVVMLFVYGSIYLFPLVIRKIKGGFNV